ncbi:hypothetical protein [Alcanivorax sp.]|uniref:hypothetical protein n=1 Tax=Alcanivorax sp. TaxID=1872427 RepID=UPI003A94A069
MHTLYRIALAAPRLLSPLAQASNTFDYVDIGYSRQNTDYSGFGDSSSCTVKASVSAFKWFHARGRYHAGNVRLPEENAQQESWSVIGLGVHYPFNAKTSIFAGSDHNKLELQNGSTERGWYHHIGLRHEFNDKWQIGLKSANPMCYFGIPPRLSKPFIKSPNKLGYLPRCAITMIWI